MKDWQKEFRNLREVLESKKYIANDLLNTVNGWPDSYEKNSMVNFYKGRVAAFEDALESLQVFEKEP